MEDNFSFIVMGATGDLAQKKLFPALHRLVRIKKVGQNFCIIGTGRKNLSSDQFRDIVKSNMPNLHEETWKILAERIYYKQLDFEAESDGFKSLGSFLDTVEEKHSTMGNRLFYLATLPKHFSGIAKKLRDNGLAETKKNWCRVVFEKPFGNDEASAKELNVNINKVFSENQIYRIDHYLGKELVQSIGILRAGNRVFSPLWNSKNIDHVQINLIEDFGIGSRGNFYDKEGALKDVGQNHLLQLLALTAMEIPKTFDEQNIRSEKTKVLKAIKKMEKEDTVFGQYEGYTMEEGVSGNSQTETFFATKLFVDNPRWKDVPFYLRSGKNLGKKFASIYIEFKEPDSTVFQNKKPEPNYLVIQIQPEDGMLVRLNGKVPGEKMGILPVKMTFCHECTFGPNTPEAYETLLYDALTGDQSAFIRSDEIEYSWKIIDSIYANKPKLFPYKKGSFGPKEADEMIEQDKRKWFNRVENVVQGL